MVFVGLMNSARRNPPEYLKSAGSRFKKKKKKVKCRRNKFSAIQTYTMCFEWIDFYLTLYLTLVFLSMKCKRYGSMENYWSYHKFN